MYNKSEELYSVLRNFFGIKVGDVVKVGNKKYVVLIDGLYQDYDGKNYTRFFEFTDLIETQYEIITPTKKGDLSCLKIKAKYNCTFCPLRSIKNCNENIYIPIRETFKKHKESVFANKEVDAVIEKQLEMEV